MQSERLQLKRASQVLVHALGGIESAAALLGKGKSVVGRWVNRNDDEHWFNLADLREAEANAPSPVVTLALARLAGGVFIPLPQILGCDSDLPLLAMELAHQLGDVSAQIAEGLANDGVLDAREAQGVLDELHELETGAATLRLWLKRHIDGGQD